MMQRLQVVLDADPGFKEFWQREANQRELIEEEDSGAPINIETVVDLMVSEPTLTFMEGMDTLGDEELIWDILSCDRDELRGVLSQYFSTGEEGADGET